MRKVTYLGVLVAFLGLGTLALSGCQSCHQKQGYAKKSCQVGCTKPCCAKK